MDSHRPTSLSVPMNLHALRDAEFNSEYLDHLIDELGIRDLLNENIPVNIGSVAKALGAESVRRANLSVAGLLIPTEKSFRVLVNKNLSPERQRFSCAHEIAHAIFDPGLTPAMRHNEQPALNMLERNCENMAAHLLMPHPAFGRYAHANAFSIKTVMKLARTFRTSIQATTIRLMDVIDEPSVAVVSKMAVGKTGSQLRVNWNYQNIRRLRRKHSYFLPKGKSLNLATADMAYRTDRVQMKSEYIDIGKLRLKCYNESKAFGFGKSRFVLSLVFPER